MICISASVRQRVMSALIGGSLRNKCLLFSCLGGIVNKLIHHPKWMLSVYIIFAYVKCKFEALCASCHEKVAWTIDMSSFLKSYNHVWDSLLVRFTWYLSISSNFLLRVLSRETRHFFYVVKCHDRRAVEEARSIIYHLYLLMTCLKIGMSETEANNSMQARNLMTSEPKRL